MATQPNPPPHYRQEVIRLSGEIVDHVSRHATYSSIPLPWGYDMNQVLEARSILNDSSWEIAGIDSHWVWFKRHMIGEYAK